MWEYCGMYFSLLNNSTVIALLVSCCILFPFTIYSFFLYVQGCYDQGSYIQGFFRSGVLHPGVLTIRGLTSRGSYDQGFLRPGVLRLYKEGKLSKGVFVKSRGRCYIQGYAQLLILIRIYFGNVTASLFALTMVRKFTPW